MEKELLFQKFHYLLEVSLSTLHTVMITTIPRTDSMLNTIKRIVDTLNQQKHFFRFSDIISIGQSVALL